MNADIELDAGTRTLRSGLLLELITGLRGMRLGDLLAVISRQPGIGDDLQAWCGFTRNSLIESSFEAGRALHHSVR